MDATAKDPLVGRLLDGRYRVSARLARGGMSTVYRAVDARLDRTVALKVMHPGLAADEEFVSRFIREAQAAARLSHPNVVSVFDQGADGDAVFLTMEYVEGRTLRELLRERGRLSAREALEILEPVLAALGSAHSAGLVHRDVKPENVLLADDGRVKVADFGLARAISSTSTTATRGMLIGTVGYLAPEQVARGVTDARSDVYAAGILLFELVTGGKPYDGDNPLQVAYRHVHEDVPAPSSRVSGLPPSVDALVGRATARDAGRRPADANALLAEVLATRRGLPEPSGQAPSLGVPGETLVVPVPFEEPVGDAPGAVVPAEPSAVVPSGDTVVVAQRQRGRRRRITPMLLLLVAALVGGGGWWYAVAGPGAYTTTPGLLALPESEAEARAAAAGLSVSYGEARFSETVERDHVLSSDPAPGERIREGAEIELALSRGKERYEVPVLEGLPREDAQASIERVNLAVGAVTRQYSDTVERGAVIESTPEAGAELKRGEAVALVVSRGVEPIEVPDVVGQPAGQAQAALTDRQFEVTMTEEFSLEVPDGRVISQDPREGNRPKGSAVALVVSKGPPPVTLPDVSGRPLAEARSTLEGLGLQVRVFNLPAGPDRVLDQNPDAGASVPAGSRVTLSVF